MIPAKIEDVFIQLTTDFSGVITNIDAGNFAKKEFVLHQSIYVACPFLEGTLDALESNEPFLLEGMVIVSQDSEYNVDIEAFKEDTIISVLIHNRTNVYKYVDQLNQNRNDLFFLKREIAEKNKELDRLRKIADKANEEKSRFLAMMSHEIRNPLNAILGYAELISSENLNDTVRQHISNLSAAGRNLKVIVDDILDLSRIEAGKLALVSEKISIQNIIKNCESDFEHQQKNENVNLSFEVADEIPEFVLGDGVRVQQILSNLISNALKFTKEGFVKTSVAVLSKNNKIVKLLFKIADSGRGMSDAQVLKIFEEYQQNKLSDQRIKGGAGLGLAIVNRLVNAMEGEISVKSKLDIGTTFSVEIPFKNHSYSEKHIEEKEAKKGKSSLQGKKILIADDDVLNQTIVQHFLTNEQAEITIVKDGLEALSKIEQETFDVILLDIYMPNLTGEELMQKTIAFKRFNINTPVLALTANTTQEDIVRYLETGFSGVISKPFTKSDFLNTIQKVFLEI